MKIEAVNTWSRAEGRFIFLLPCVAVSFKEKEVALCFLILCITFSWG